MLSNFTWWQFFGTFLLLCAFYYPFILWVYFKPDLQYFFRKLISGHSGPEETAPDDNPSKALQGDSTVQPVVTSVDSNKILRAIEEDIHSGIKAAKDANADKTQVLGLLKNVLLKYPELKLSGERVKVNELLIQECGQAGYVLYMAEAFALWPTTSNQQA